jgi:hypothetical protein
MDNRTYSSIFFSLNEEDIQTVAKQEIERNLSKTEIESIKELIASNINWYDAIANAIREKIKTEERS